MACSAPTCSLPCLVEELVELHLCWIEVGEVWEVELVELPEGPVIIKHNFDPLIAWLINLSSVGCPLELLNLILECFDLVLVDNELLNDILDSRIHFGEHGPS